MDILIVNAFDHMGGAARAAGRLNKALQAAGAQSCMLVMVKEGAEEDVIGPESKFRKRLEFPIRASLEQRALKGYSKSQTQFSTAHISSARLVQRINSLNPDIVHLHWINAGMLSIKDLSKINAPVVWSLHDMWPFTGGCHYSEGCERYTVQCGACPVLGSNREKDLSRQVHLAKSLSYGRKKDLVFIGLSGWMAESARQSSLCSSHEVRQLPNPIDTSLFKPIKRSVARDIMGLPQDKKIVAFGAMNPLGDPRKGFRELSQALERLKDRSDVELLLFGSGRPANEPEFPHPTHYAGRLADQLSLAVLYNAPDVVVVPSLEENLSNVIMESVSCGTPVVGFSIGGNGDMISHQESGYLAEPEDTADLADGISWILDHPDQEQLRSSARAKVEKEFSEEVVAKRYLDLYESLLKP